MGVEDEMEKQAETIRWAVANADTEGLARFMEQYSRADVAERLIAQMPREARKLFLEHLFAFYAAELAVSAAGKD